MKSITFIKSDYYLLSNPISLPETFLFFQYQFILEDVRQTNKSNIPAERTIQPTTFRKEEITSNEVPLMIILFSRTFFHCTL